MTFDADDPRHQDFESSWWGNCAMTFSEENKQLVYMAMMGVTQVSLGEVWPVYLGGGRRIIDVGGGPVSPLLKTVQLRRGVVLDPGEYPEWTRLRYESAGIEVVRERAEDWLHATSAQSFDECWMMNCLQHTVDPERIAAGMRLVASTIRVFEWIETPPTLGHPHELHATELDKWFGGKGHIESINRNGCVGLCYSGVFRK